MNNGLDAVPEQDNNPADLASEIIREVQRCEDADHIPPDADDAEEENQEQPGEPVEEPPAEAPNLEAIQEDERKGRVLRCDRVMAKNF